MKVKREQVEESTTAFSLVADALGGMQRAGLVLGISRTAMVQYVHHGARPTPRRAVRVLHTLAGKVDPALVVRLANVLEVPEPERPRAPSPGALADAPPPDLRITDALDLAVLASAERREVHPGRARQVVLDVLARAGELGVSANAAHAALLEAAARQAGRSG